ncbi:ABC transporter substrate-binding protein [Acidovorax sp. NCPPB 3576]|uniref:ABC transporter substrate-binding protein n=1 Tax=Acidovorax sp. NCPPB 3576 TaxID=2940488 RepID=UPI00234AB34C|nr:ABC transporter substrate-binding protein [Acidovorax sp. NCPPB 3576]WCM87068.1 ABC transporter substrate-binding protein [Acidovorax sp. NCPPB 3576]
MTHLPFLRRRHFLGSSGTAAAALALPAAAAIVPAPARRAAQVGVFQPTSARYPTLAAEFTLGLESAFAAQDLPAPSWVPLPYQQNPGPAVRQARAALQDGALDMLAGWIPLRSALELRDDAQQRGIPLLASDTGADKAPAIGRTTPWIVNHTLELWQSTALLGQLAPRRWGTRAVVCTGFLESGYDFPVEFRKAFGAAGGRVAATHVSGLPDGSAEFAGLLSAVKGARPDFVLALYSGAQAERFHAAYQRAGLHTQYPLLGSRFSHGHGSDPAAPAFLPSVASWEDPGAACAAVAAACRQQGMRFTGAALLGFEAGQRIAAVLAASGDAERLSALHSAQTTQARGTRRYDAATQESNGPHWLHAQGNAIAIPSPESAAIQTAAAIRHRTPESGWSSPYLIT